MAGRYRLYGWHLSYFTGKVRCYLRYKRIPFEDRPVDLFTLTQTIKRKTGEVVMPVLVTPEREWLQDSSVIIDTLEVRFPERPVIPITSVQRFAAYLFEAWADECWVPIAMHTRWSFPENYALFEREAGGHLLPGFPRVLQNRAAGNVAKMLRSLLPNVGVRPEQFETMNAWTAQMLDWLDAAFAAQPYLFGGHPTLADFGLVGTMYAHLGRDPWPARELIAPRKHLRAWIDRMADPPETFGSLMEGDELPPALAPVFNAIFAEFTPLIEGIAAQTRAALASAPPGKALPRGLGDVEAPMGAGRFKRVALPYTLWMAQRALNAYRDAAPAERARIEAFAARHGGARFLALDLPPLQRVGLRVAAA